MLRLLFFLSALFVLSTFHVDNVYSRTKVLTKGVRAVRSLSQSTSAMRSMGVSPHVVIQSQRARQVIDLARTSRILGLSTLVSQFDGARTDEAKFAQFEQILQRIQNSGDQQLMAQSDAFISAVDSQVRNLQGQQNLSSNEIENALRSGLTLNGSSPNSSTVNTSIVLTDRQVDLASQNIEDTTHEMREKGFAARSYRLRNLLQHLLTSSKLILLGAKAAQCVTRWANVNAVRNLADILLNVMRDTITYVHARVQILQGFVNKGLAETPSIAMSNLNTLINPPCETLHPNLVQA